MHQIILDELAPTGILRAGINLGNPLLVSGRDADGNPVGVAPALAREIAARLGVPMSFVLFEKAGLLAEAAGTGLWDIGLLAIEPARATKIAFAGAYAEIEAAYLVPVKSSIKTVRDVDHQGVRISTSLNSAYDLWLQRKIKYAELVPAANFNASLEQFIARKLEVLAGLRSVLLSSADKNPGHRVLDKNFTTLQQAVATNLHNRMGLSFLKDFVEHAKASGLIKHLIEMYKVDSLSVAPPSSN